jgi:hypothetical protein
MTVWLQSCPSLQLLQSFFQNIAVKGYLRQTNGYTVSILQKKTFLRSVDPKQPSNFHFDPSMKLSQGEVHDFSGEVQKFSREVQNDLRGGAHLPTPPLKIRPWDKLN